MQSVLVKARGMALGVLVLMSLTLAPLAHAAAVTISGVPLQAVISGQPYAFTPTAKADAGKTLKFSIMNKPTWASFNTGTGALTGTPTQSGTWTKVTISVSDGKTTATLPGFTISVTLPKKNKAPTISGTPPKTVTVGQAYHFVPKATDPEGHPLKFSIRSKPGWASFDTATGRLSGVPNSTQVGSHEQIQISVSDGAATASLPIFAIRVDKAANPTTRSVTLLWTPPTRNDDGSSLTDLRGYRILYGTKSRTYTSSIKLANPSLSSYLIENLPAGKYYFAMVAYNAAGEESDLSVEVSADLS